MVNIGKKIRALRLGNSLTQEELAKRLELTKGYISQLENNLTSPSMQTLFSILEELGTDIHEFFSQEEEQQVVFKKEDFHTEENQELKHMMSWVVPNALKYEMEPVIIEIEPEGQSEIDQPHAGEEFGYVLEGQITLVLNKRRYVIRKGETFYYLANKEHYLMNPNNQNAKVLWVSTPPMF
ncbi:MAG: cupin domain-containing protein [Clostridia bacterium]|nr:cupin domain-containing protein [Clostridia bacterium]